MAVSLWVVLGISLLLIGLPFVLLGPISPFAYAVGAGVAFLIVAAAQWVWGAWGRTVDPDLDSDDSASNHAS